MPGLPISFATLIAAGPLPLDDYAAQPLQNLPRAEVRIVARQAVDLLGTGAGALLIELGLPRSDIPPPLQVADLRSSSGFAQIVAGTRTVGRGLPDRVLARLVQRALQAVAARVRGAPAALTLPRWGADGSFGDEAVAAVTAFQAWRNLPITGTFGAAEAAALMSRLTEAPIPDLFDAGHPVVVLRAGARRIVAIAQALVAATRAAPFSMRVDGVRYSYFAEQFGVPATSGIMRAPGGIGYGLASKSYWKCNIFGGVVLSLAELPVPTFEVPPYRHYPRAERFGDALARKPGWTLLAHLDHRDPANHSRALTSAAFDAEIRALLRRMRPGDLFFVDHPGEPGDNGGHTRICTRAAENDDATCAPMFAQARHDAAHLKPNGLPDLAGGRETQFWLLRTTL